MTKLQTDAASAIAGTASVRFVRFLPVGAVRSEGRLHRSKNLIRSSFSTRPPRGKTAKNFPHETFLRELPQENPINDQPQPLGTPSEYGRPSALFSIRTNDSRSPYAVFRLSAYRLPKWGLPRNDAKMVFVTSLSRVRTRRLGRLPRAIILE